MSTVADGASRDPDESSRRLVATSARRTRWSRRLPTALVVIGLVAGVTAAVTGATASVPGLVFLPEGHWVFNTVLQAAFHIDGDTAGVDARANVPGDPGSQVVQDDNSGYVVGHNRITVFGKSGLSVEESLTPAADETPLAIEAAGGPYLVYRNAGKVTRLGQPAVTVETGGAIGDPVVTAGGTMWLFRPQSGLFCELPRTARQVTSCPAKVPGGHTGALTLVGDQPRFLDTTTSTLVAVDEHGTGAAVPVGVPTSPDTRPAASDVEGHLPILDRHTHQLHLIDTRDPARAPITVKLPDGDYDGPTAGKSVVAVVDRKSDRVLTYDDHGKQRDAKPIPADAGDPRLTRGEDHRVYVEGSKGTHVMVVDDEGKVDDVPVTGDPDQHGKRPVPDHHGGPDQHGQQPGNGTDQDGRSQQQQQQLPRRTEQPPVRQDDSRPRKDGADGRGHRQPPVVPASPPGAPASVSATPGDKSATVTWGAANANGAPVTGYLISWRSSAGATGTRTVDGSSRTATITGLTNGQRYTISVAASNKAGRGTAAAAEPVTPVAPARPAAAPDVTAIYDPSKGGAVVNWSTPDLRGGKLVHYLVDATGLARQTTTGTSMIMTGLPSDGSQVVFTVRAVTKAPDGSTVTGAPGRFTTQGSPGRSVRISRGPADCEDHPDEPTCAQMHVVLTGFEPNTKYTISPHSDNPDYHAGDAHRETDDNGDLAFDSFQYYWAGDKVWVTVHADDGDVDSNHLTWTAS